jgi:hypothetical protein
VSATLRCVLPTLGLAAGAAREYRPQSEPNPMTYGMFFDQQKARVQVCRSSLFALDAESQHIAHAFRGADGEGTRARCAWIDGEGSR